MKMTFDSEQIVRAKVQIEQNVAELERCNIPNIFIKKKLISSLAEELFKSGLITFNEKPAYMPGHKIYSAEIQIILDNFEYIDLQTFIDKASKDITSVFKSLIRPGQQIDIKDCNDNLLYIGNFVKINDNGNEVVQVILPALENVSTVPYIGGVVYENGDIKCFDVNYVYSDTVLPPNIEKIRTIKK